MRVPALAWLAGVVVAAACSADESKSDDADSGLVNTGGVAGAGATGGAGGSPDASSGGGASSGGAAGTGAGAGGGSASGGASGFGGAGTGGAGGAAGAAGSGGSASDPCAIWPPCLTGMSACGDACVDIKTDLSHCGACNSPCSAGLCVAGACNPALPRVLVTGTNIGPIVVDATAVYYFDGSVGELRSVPKAGGAPTSLSKGVSGVGDIEVDATHVYWSSTGSSAIQRVSKSGGTPEVVAATPTPYQFAVDGTYVYWFDSSNLVRAPKNGTGLKSLLAIDSNAASGIVVDGTHVFWAGSVMGGLSRLAKDGTGAILKAPKGGLRLEFDGAELFTFDSSKSEILAVPTTFASSRVVTPTWGPIQTLKVGKRFVFFTGSGQYSWASGAKAAKCGGSVPYPPPKFPDAPPYPPSLKIGTALALDDDHLYTFFNGELRRGPQ